MGISLETGHLKRYADVARLLWKYGRSDVVREAGLAEALEDEEDPGTAPAEAAELADDLEALGPTFIKLGQILSTRADLLPLPYLEALARLQDEVEPFGFGDVERIVQEELGARISKAFARFDGEPLAAASLGQVHYAVLRDGREVAVKVQRPGIRGRIAEDLDTLDEIAGFLDEHTEWGRRFGFRDTVQEFGSAVRKELDYRQEASHLLVIGENLGGYDRGRSPTSSSKRTSSRSWSTGCSTPTPTRGTSSSPTTGAWRSSTSAWVARVSPRMRDRLLRLLIAVAEGDADVVADVALDVGEVVEGLYDERGFRQRIGELVGHVEHATVREIEVGKVVMEISRIAVESGVRAPRELAMLGKALLNLDAVGRVLAPDFDPNAAIRGHAADLTTRRVRGDLSPGAVFASLLETAEFVQELPGRVNRILDRLASNELEIRVDSVDERTLVEGFQKVANRIATGLVLAALIVGAAMLMRVETRFTILGYPGLAILCFLAAAAAGMLLILDIVRHDRGLPPRRRSGPRA